MKIRRGLLMALVLTCGAVPVQAQWSSDIPGVPRASLPFRGSHQNRTDWVFTGFKLPAGGDVGDTVAGGLSLSLGRSYLVATRFEVGFDLTLLDGFAVKPPSPADAPADAASDTYLRGVTLYGIRIGGKFRPFSALDPDGYGWEAAVGAAVQPGLRPLFGVERFADSTRTGGQFNSEDDDIPLRGAEPFATLQTSTTLSGMVSYRSRRLTFDAALLAEKGTDEEADTTSSGIKWPAPTGVYDGVSLNVGVAYRLRPSFSLGAAYWGKGAPPWRSEIMAGRPGKIEEEQFGVLLSFGSQPEAGTDLMISSPTGAFGESLRLLVRLRATR